MPTAFTLSSTATTATANVVSNNVEYNMDGNGTVYSLYNGSSSNALYYYNTVYLNNQANMGTGATYGFYKTTGIDVEFINNIVWASRAGTGANYALYLSSATGTISSDYNDLVVGDTTLITGYYAGPAYPVLADWHTVNMGGLRPI